MGWRGFTKRERFLTEFVTPSLPQKRLGNVGEAQISSLGKHGHHVHLGGAWGTEGGGSRRRKGNGEGGTKG